MTHEEWLEINGASSFPPKIEGYWRPELKLPFNYGKTEAGKDFSYWNHNKYWKYPFPVVIDIEGFGASEKFEFLSLLREMQESPFTARVTFRGVSKNRLTGECNGNSEYTRDDWFWPSGYITYIESGVPPSRDFYRYITTVDLPTLPSYGR
jgi:hypothetical protein